MLYELTGFAVARSETEIAGNAVFNYAQAYPLTLVNNPARARKLALRAKQLLAAADNGGWLVRSAWSKANAEGVAKALERIVRLYDASVRVKHAVTQTTTPTGWRQMTEAELRSEGLTGEDASRVQERVA